ELAARGYSELAIWYLALGDRAAAARAAAKGQSLAGPSTVGLATAARFLTQDPAPAAIWAERAHQLVPNDAQEQARDVMLAYALLFGRGFAAALPILERMYARSTPASEENLAALLAWAYVESGRIADAAPLLRLEPIPPIGGPSPFLLLS